MKKKGDLIYVEIPLFRFDISESSWKNLINDYCFEMFTTQFGEKKIVYLNSEIYDNLFLEEIGGVHEMTKNVAEYINFFKIERIDNLMEPSFLEIEKGRAFGESCDFYIFIPIMEINGRLYNNNQAFKDVEIHCDFLGIKYSLQFSFKLNITSQLQQPQNIVLPKKIINLTKDYEMIAKERNKKRVIEIDEKYEKKKKQEEEEKKTIKIRGKKEILIDESFDSEEFIILSKKRNKK